MDNSAIKRSVLHHSAYFLLIFVGCLLQTVPNLFSLGGACPIIVIGSVVAISMFEKDFLGGIYGLFAGFLCDFWGFELFGFASILFLIMGTVCGLLIIYLMQNNIRTFLLLTFGFTCIYCLLSYYVIFGMWGYEHSGLILLFKTAPTVILTVLFAVPQYYIVRKLFNHMYT